MKIFISLPITGHHVQDRMAYVQNIKNRIHHSYPDYVEILSPFDIPDYHDGESWGWYMARTIDLLSKCDTICICHGYMTSQGCQVEMEYAKSQGINIIYEDDLVI